MTTAQARARPTSTPPASRVASRGSKRPAPTSSVDAVPAATALRSASSALPPVDERGEERGEQHVARADGRDDVDLRRGGAQPAPHPLLAQQRVTAGRLVIKHVARTELGDPVERERKSSCVVELLADERLRLALVRRDERSARPRRRGAAARPRESSTVWIAAPVQVADRLGVEARVDPARQRAREHDVLGRGREVAQLLAQHLELVLLDLRPPLVDLGERVRHRVDDGGGGARLVADADEVVEDRLVGELLEDPRARPAAGEAGRDDRDVQPLERARDVDPLAAGERQARARAVAVAELEVRHGQRAVERRVHRDGDDHRAPLGASNSLLQGGWAGVGVSCGLAGQRQGQWNHPPIVDATRFAYQPAFEGTPGAETDRAATSGERADQARAVVDPHLAEPVAAVHRQGHHGRRHHHLA